MNVLNVYLLYFINYITLINIYIDMFYPLNIIKVCDGLIARPMETYRMSN
jgi:hypothetical protein